MYDFDRSGELNMVEISLLIEYSLVGFCKLTDLPCPNEAHIDRFTEKLFDQALGKKKAAQDPNDMTNYAYQLSR